MRGPRGGRGISWLGAALAGLLVGGCEPCPGVRIRVVGSSGEERLSVCAEVADTEARRRQGLAGRPSLGDGEGMLLDFPLTGEVCITGEGMEFPVDVVFVDGDGVVVEVVSLGMKDGRSICESGVRRVLEVSRGVAEGVESGDRVTVSEEDR